MVTREQRLAQFNTDVLPPAGQAVHILCEDHNGTYVTKFLCVHEDGQWLNSENRAVIAVTVIGWQSAQAC